MYLQIFFCFFLVQLSGCLFVEETKCVITNARVKEKSNKISLEVAELTQYPITYSCPRELDPKSFTKCCNNGDCCKPSVFPEDMIDESLLMVVATMVICSCIVLTILSVICCFWSKCPLYNTCKANYNTNNVIVYSLSKEDPNPLMPAEGNKGAQYKPYPVKIKKVLDV